MKWKQRLAEIGRRGGKSPHRRFFCVTCGAKVTKKTCDLLLVKGHSYQSLVHYRSRCCGGPIAGKILCSSRDAEVDTSCKC